MPLDLQKAHKQLDEAVECAYGIRFDADEDEITSYLFRLYARIARQG